MRIPTALARSLRRGGALGTGTVAAGLFAAVALPAWHLEATLGEPALVSGYALMGLVLALAAFGARKKLPMLPGPSALWWKRAHVAGGLLAIALLWLHTGTGWPTGAYERVLAALFYALSVSGVLGVASQHVYPRRLTQTGAEVIFERIPHEAARLRERAEEAVLSSAREHGSDTLARIYVESLQWFFRRPRFLLSHLLGGRGAEFWVTQRLLAAERYLGDAERAHLAALGELAREKVRLDAHYALQGWLRAWPLAHVPLAVGTLALALWHMLLVHVYAL